MKILIVDDSPILRSLMVRALRAAGYEGAAVVEAADGAEALARLEEGNVSLVLSDLDMPRMGGMQLLDRMQASPALAAIPVVMVTTERGRHVQEQLRARGARGCVGKPVEPEELGRVIGPLLAGAGDDRR